MKMMLGKKRLYKGIKGINLLIKNFFLPEQGRLRFPPFLVIAIVGVVAGVFFSSTNLIRRLEWSAYDRFMRLSSKSASEAPGIVVVAIDELSFKEVGLPWPWPRSLHAELIRNLHRGGARTVVLDILFDQPGVFPEDDRLLIDAIREAGKVVLAADRYEIEDQAYSVTQWVEPFPEILEVAMATGIVSLPYDPDGVIRKSPLSFSGRPGLALASALFESEFDTPNGLSQPRLINFRGPPRIGIKTVSYYQALKPGEMLPEGIFRDKIVLVGLSLGSAPEITGAADHYISPLGLPMAGVFIHANLLDSLLRGRFIADPFSSFLSMALLCLVLGLVFVPVMYRVGVLSGALVTVGSGWILFLIGYLFFAVLQLMLPVISLVVVLISLFLVAYGYRFMLGIIERRLILGAFKHYLAPAIVEQILSNPSQLRLGGAEYEVTILFTDLAGFTTISESLSPTELRTLLTTYFQEMMEILTGEHATLDKFIGDAIMVYFGCPVIEPGHPAQACRAAVAMQWRLQQLNLVWRRQGLQELRMRVGINTGFVIAGNMGTEKIFNYTILGDSVNLASRLEGVNKEYGTSTIISQYTYERVRDEVAVRELDSIRVKGKARPVSIYELAVHKGDLSPKTEELWMNYAEGLSSYRRMRWDQAISKFRQALAIDENDQPSKTLLERCYSYRQGPPPPGWDGVHIMRTK